MGRPSTQSVRPSCSAIKPDNEIFDNRPAVFAYCDSAGIYGIPLCSDSACVEVFMTVVKLLDAHMPRPESGVDMLRLVFKSPDICRHQPAYGVVMQYVAFRCKALPVVRKAVVVVKHTSCHKNQRNYFHCRRRLLLLSPCCRAVARKRRGLHSQGGFTSLLLYPARHGRCLAMALGIVYGGMPVANRCVLCRQAICSHVQNTSLPHHLSNVRGHTLRIDSSSSSSHSKSMSYVRSSME